MASQLVYRTLDPAVSSNTIRSKAVLRPSTERVIIILQCCWSVACIGISIFQQTDRSHFTNWIFYLQTAYFGLTGIAYLLPTQQPLQWLVYMVCLPATLADTFAVFIGSTYLLLSNAYLFEYYKLEYGRTKVGLGHFALHCIPLMLAIVNAILFRDRLVPLRPRGIKHYMLVIVTTATLLPLIYVMFYNPVVVYGATESRDTLNSIILVCLLCMLTGWFVFLSFVIQPTSKQSIDKYKL